MKKKLIFFPVLLIVMTLYISCANNSSKKEEASSQPIEIRYPDKGDFHVLYSLIRQPNAKTINAKIIIDKISQDGLVSEMMGELNKVFKLPHNVIIQFRYSDSINAWYDPSTRYIHFSSRFIELFINKFAPYYERRELIDKVTNVVVFFLFHELGHALIDIYDLTIKGPEEDMADYFSVFLLSTWNDKVKQMALDGADMFYQLSKESLNQPVGSLALWDTHSLSMQRFYKICCLIYGSDPQTYNYLRTRNLVLDGYEGGCIDEYPKVINGWKRDLDFFLQPEMQQQ